MYLQSKGLDSHKLESGSLLERVKSGPTVVSGAQLEAIPLGKKVTQEEVK